MTVAATLRSLSGQFGLNATELATFLQPEGESYPSPGLIRTVMSETAPATERLTCIVDTCVADLAAQVEPSSIVAIHLAGRVRRVCTVDSKRRATVLIRIAPEVDIDLDDTDALLDLLGAYPGVDPERKRTCPICGQLFIASSRRQAVCHRRDKNGRHPCVTERDRRKRAEKRLETLESR